MHLRGHVDKDKGHEDCIEVVPNWDYTEYVMVIAVHTLRQFWALHPKAEQPIKSWVEEVRFATWQSPADLKLQFGSASILKNNRVVFNLGGNKYRLVTAVLYRSQTVLIKFIGTHLDYDQIDAQTVNVREER